MIAVSKYLKRSREKKEMDGYSVLLQRTRLDTIS